MKPTKLIKKFLIWKIKTNMKLDVINDSLAQTDIAKMSVNIDNLTYSLMIDGIYTNKLNSVVRELSTNARDSQIAVGNLNPYTVTLTANDIVSKGVLFSIKDEGLGLSKEDSETYLCNLNASNKRESDEATGCFGIGSKSPFSLTDNYSFNCIKDGIKTELNLFRINNETPRFTLNTSNTSEINSVECLLKLTDYSLNDVLKAVYVELALFDIQPRIKIVLPSTEVVVEPHEFFCKFEESEDFYRLSYGSPSEEILSVLGMDFLTDFYQALKTTKKVSCGIVGYQADAVATPHKYYSSLPTEILSGFYIVKFDLNSDLKFDVSRENIAKDSATDTLIKNKVLNSVNNVNVEECVKFLTILTIATSVYRNRLYAFTNIDRSILGEYCPHFYENLQSSLQGSHNSPISIDMEFLEQSLKDSLEYYKNNLDELKAICFLATVSIQGLNYYGRASENSFINFVYNSNFSLETSATLEKVYLNSTQIWEEGLNSEVLFFNTKSLFESLPNFIFYRYLGSDVPSSQAEDKFKIYTFKPTIIKNLTEFELHVVSNHKQLKNVSELYSLMSNYEPSREFSNTLIIVYQGLKSLVVDLDLKDNLRDLTRGSCVSVYDLEQYSDVSPDFVESLKKLPRASTSVAREPGEARTEVQTHNSFGVKLRNKFDLIYHKNISISSADLETTETSLTSLAFYKLLSQLFPKDHYSSFSYMLLIDKDIVKTEEEKLLVLQERATRTVFYIFEIDNPDSYSDIKDVCECFLKHEFRVTADKHLPSVFELNTKFKQEEALNPYSKILTWFLNTTSVENAFKDLLEYSEEVPESELLSEDLNETEEGSAFTSYYNNSSEASLKSKKLLSFSQRLGVSLNTKTSYFREFSSDFRGISALLSSSILDDILGLKDVNYSKNDFSTRYSTPSMFNVSNSTLIPVLDKFLTLNDNMMYNRMFNLEYLNNLKETKSFPIVSFNTQNFHNLLKEY